MISTTRSSSANKRVSAEDVKRTALAQGWKNVFASDISAELLDGKEHPCPKCGGTDRFFTFKDFAETGAVACRKCHRDSSTGDGIGTIAWIHGISPGEAIRVLAERLNVSGIGEEPERDVIAEVCKDKRMPLEAFLQFGPVAEKRGRGRELAARVPVYNERGETHSYFDFIPGKKGFFARGVGMSGMFFPGRIPQPGETWLLPEGCKDAAVLIGLGFNAAGLPSSCMADKYARLFAGVHVVLVPDLDSAGQAGAQKTGGRLAGVAASVRVARLPGEIVEKGGDDVRDILKRADGETLVREAIANAQEWQPREGEHDPKDGRPEVLVSLAYGLITDQVVKHIGELGWASPWIPAAKRDRLKLYQRGGMLVQVVTEDAPTKLAGGVTVPAGTTRIRPLPPGQLPLRIADACQLLVEKEVDGEIQRAPTSPPKWMIDGIHTRGEFGRDVRPIEGIITAPTLRPDGTILQAPGYDDKTALLHCPSDRFPSVPDKPTQADAKAAAETLLEVVKDFPFQDDADRSAWLALVLSQIGRTAIEGCVPMFAITATCRASGKSLLADAASLISCGRPAARKPYSPDDDEQRKAITATAIEALPAVLLDNIDTTLGGAALDAALTAYTWTDRILGKSATTGELPLRTVWAATGNNLRFGTDIARRVLPIRLVPSVENPEERTDFEHPDLLSWVRANRPRLAVAALTILRAYFVAGRPVQSAGTWGSYEAWSALIRGAIVWAGLPDPLATRATAKADDNSNSIVRGLIGGLLEMDDSGRGLTVREIVAMLNDHNNNDRFPAMREVVGEVATVRGTIEGRKLTYVFRKYKGRIANGWQLFGEDAHGGVIRWNVREVKSGDDGDHVDHQNSQPYVRDLCVTHTDAHVETRATHIYGTGDPEESSPPSSPSSPCPACGATMIPAPEVCGWVNLDCPKCGHVKPVKVTA